MSETNKDKQEVSKDDALLSQEALVAEGKSKADNSSDSASSKVKTTVNQNEAKEKIDEDKDKDDFDKDFLKDDDDLPEDIKKKLEKKKNEKSKGSKKTTAKRKKKKVRGRVEVGKAYVKATYNNTIVTLTDLNGEVISWASAGVAGFKGPKKSTPYAAQIITKIATIKAKQDYGLKEVSVFVKGVGMGRESAIRTINSQGLLITSIKDITPIPHNGCRPRKPRRV